MKPIDCIHVEHCGNCPDLHISQEEKEANKQQWLAEFLQFPTVQFVSSPKQEQYRSRISLRPNAKGELGYYKPKTHSPVPISQCSIAHEKINAALKSFPQGQLPVKAVEFRTDGEHLLVNILSRKGNRPKKQLLQHWLSDDIHGIGIDAQSMVGQKKLHLSVCGVQHQISLGSFYQVNLEINQLLVQTILNWVQEHQPSKVLDLYCGIGNIGCAIAAQGIPVIGIESAPSSVADGRSTIKRHNLNMELRKGDADRFQAGDAYFDVAILDPPRKGAGAVIQELRYTNPKAIFYVSCNPYALQKDLREAKKWGYLPSRMTAFDMFPHTPHVETLVELRKE